MEIATMQFRFTCFVLFFTTGFVNTDKQCRMPSGNAGECKLLKKCTPLFELNKKKGKTEHELLYVRQSLTSCPITSSFQPLICCPPVSQWSDFKSVKPVMFDEIVKYDVELKEKPNVNSNNIHDITDVGNRNNNDDKNKIGDTTLPTDYIMQNYGTECGKDAFGGNRIIGGGPANIDQFPWLVLLEYEDGATLCGGSLITRRFVLTAAHCIQTSKGAPKAARLAEYNTSSYPTDIVEVDGGGFEEITVDIISIEKSIAHPNFTRAHLHHDIALSKLIRDAVLGDFIKLICLPTQDSMKYFNIKQNLTVAGWGSDTEKFSEVKKFVQVPFVPTDECRLSYRLNRLIDAQICAGGRPDEDSCSGDSGGPLMYEHNFTYTAIGIVSFGNGMCGTEGTPAVYTYVFSYLDWLNVNMV